MITDVRVTLIPNARADRSGDRLLAFCSVILGDAFVIRDVKIIGSTRGPFIAMPSRRLADRCPECGGKNHRRARYCNECGDRLSRPRVDTDGRGRQRLHADIAHPINAEARNLLERLVLEAYDAEVERSKAEGYAPVADEGLDDD